MIGVEPYQHTTNLLPNVSYDAFYREEKQHGPTEELTVSIGIIRIFTSHLSFSNVILEDINYNSFQCNKKNKRSLSQKNSEIHPKHLYIKNNDKK